MAFEHTTDGAPEHPLVTTKRFDARRLYIALVFIPLLYVLIRYLPPQALFTFVVAAAILTLFEFYRLHFGQERAPLEFALGAVLTGLLLVNMQWPALVPTLSLWLLFLFLVLISRLLSKRALKQNLTDSGILLLGILYIGLTLGHLPLIRGLHGGIFLIFFLLLVTWAGDAGAYFAGRTLGRHKLAPVISPNKTVEGFVGGLLLATVAALVAKLWFLPSLTILDCTILGLGLAGVGALGDLAESAMKRSVGVKDSSHLIPGHGGLLDRLDSLLFTTPTFYYYVTLVNGMI